MAYNHRVIIQEKLKDARRLSDYDSLLKKRRNFSTTAFKENENVVLLLSGGLDSVGLWIYLLTKYRVRVFPLYLHEGSLKIPQYKAIRYYSKILRSRFPGHFEPVKDIKIHNSLFIYSRLKREMSVKLPLGTIFHNLTFSSDRKKYVPVFQNQPSRTAMFVLSAYDYAASVSLYRNIRIGKIIYGLTPEEDKIRGSELPLLRLLSLTLCEITRDDYWQVLAPIDKSNKFYLTKRQLVTHCQNQGIGLERSWSCGKSDNYHCGMCFNCYFRRKAFKESGIADNTKYRRTYMRDFLSNLYWKWKTFTFQLLNKSTQSVMVQKFSLSGRFKINPRLQWMREKNKLYILNGAKGYIEELEGEVIEVWDLLASKSNTLTELTQSISHNKKEILTFLKQAVKDNYVLYE